MTRTRWSRAGAALALMATAFVGTTHTSTVRAASPIPDDGQVTLKFATVPGPFGLRTQNTVPWWTSSFSFGGQSYPYAMVGINPSSAQSTTIPAYIIPLKFTFSPASNFLGGNYSDVRDPYTVDPTTGTNAVDGTVSSPIFQNKSWPDGVGTTQWGDAVMRATFNKTGKNGYHVLLGRPTVLPEVTQAVPANLADVHRISARIDEHWFDTVIHQVLNTLHLPANALPIFVTYDTFLYLPNDPSVCCFGGSHEAFQSLQGNGAQQVQTLIYTSWVTPGIGTFSPNTLDVAVLSHEVSEWLNDPFIDNNVPAWQGLGPFPFCQGNLETGDAVADLDNAFIPAPLNGVTYHVQTEALLPWFERQSPSTAVAGAYSYPDTSLVTSVAQSC